MRLREEVKSIISGVCESGDCSSFSMLKVLCLVPVVLDQVELQVVEWCLVKFQHA